MSAPLSSRLRPGIECAPWVIDEVKRLEAHLSQRPSVPEGYALIGVDALKAWGVYDQVRDACQSPVAQKPQAEASPTAGMNMAQRILHVGGRNNAAGYVEFGSIQAVEALVRQVIRDLQAPQQAEAVPQSWRTVLPGGKHTDKWESSRVADYNQGWNDYRKAANANLEKLEAAPQQAEAVPKVCNSCDDLGFCIKPSECAPRIAAEMVIKHVAADDTEGGAI